MKKTLAYFNNYGAITEIVRLDQDVLPQDLDNNIDYIEVDETVRPISVLTHYVDTDNKITEYSVQQRSDLLAIKGSGWIWAPRSGGWLDNRDPSVKLSQQWDSIRKIRGQKLQESDWTMLIDVPLSESKKSEWAQYRQALRDITNQLDPFNIIWPTIPGN